MSEVDPFQAPSEVFVNSQEQFQQELDKHLETSKTLRQIVYEQFKQHKAAVVGFYTILVFVLIALGAPLISQILGIDPTAQNVFARYKPPFSQVKASSDVREKAVNNFTSKHPAESQALQNELISKKIVNPVRPEDALYDLADLDKDKALLALNTVDHPIKIEVERMIKGFDAFHILGTDELGRDVLMRLIYGTRVSMGVSVLVALASALIGLIIGSIAGFYGGLLDTVLMRVTDALLSLPLLPVLIVVAAIDLQKIPGLNWLISAGNESVVKLVVILCLFSWMTVARLVRGSILSLREREFILASKTLGATDSTIILRHMFPNVIAPMLVAVTLGVGESILFEAALSFLGLGIQPPTPSWGNMLTNALELIDKAPYLAILPGLLILIVTISFNYFGDGLQDAIDPKSIKR